MTDNVRAAVVCSADAERRERWSRALGQRCAVREVMDLSGLEYTLAALRPSVLVLDVGLPGLGGVDGLQAVHRLSPATATIVLTDAESEGEGVSALVAGARGYCGISIDAALLAKAVDAIQRGEVWVKRALVPALVGALVSHAELQSRAAGSARDRRLDRLTQRQREVAEAIARGASNKEIARRLNVTERTVKAHLTEMFRNVGVLDRLHLALLLNDVPGAWFDVSPLEAANAAGEDGGPASPSRSGGSRAGAAQSD